MNGEEERRYRAALDRALVELYGVTLRDVGGDEMFGRIYGSEWTPEEAARWVGERYDLVPRDERGW